MAGMVREPPPHSYTVRPVAELSGVTVGTLHHYVAMRMFASAAEPMATALNEKREEEQW